MAGSGTSFRSLLHQCPTHTALRAGITAAGIIGPVLGSINVPPIVIGLAIASGAMFALQVNSNFFWMFKSLLGLSTQGTFKTLTMVTSIASVVSLPMVMAVALIA